MAPSRLISSLALAMTLTFMAPASAFAPVHRLAPKKVNLAMSQPKLFARNLLKIKGMGYGEYACLSKLWQRESSWWYKSKNPTSTAFGIAQMITETSRDPAVQINRGLAYIFRRYETPCGAWHFWISGHYWY